MLYNCLKAPILSICIPAYNRPQWIKRAILSVISAAETEQLQTEIIISDDSTTMDCRHIVHELLADWKGRWQYHANSPSLGMAANWNRCIQMSTGSYVLLLHDDDYLEVKALRKVLQTLRHNPSAFVLLFSVNVVTASQKIIKRQAVERQQYIKAADSLKLILTNSSFIRFPGMVIRKEAFEAVGYFDERIEGIADIQLWVRLCSEYGLLCIPIITANYTVHANALTMRMFKIQTLEGISKIFDEVERIQLLPTKTMQTCKANYFHQFILAGTVRYIKMRNFKEANAVLTLFDQVDVRLSKASVKWKLIKFALKMLLSYQKLPTAIPRSNKI